jgi:Glycosyltransferase 61
MIKNGLFTVIKKLDRLGAKLPSVAGFQPLRGEFRAWERLQEGRYKGDVLYHGQPLGPCPTGSVTERSRLNQHDFQPWPAFWTSCEDARLVGKLWHWRDKADLLCRESVFGLLERRRLGEDRITSQWFPGKPQILEGPWTSITSNWGDGRNYFHWILDSLTRLRVREELPEATRILIPHDSAPYIRETLELLGLDELAACPPFHCVQPELYYFCSPTAMTGVWNPLGFDWLRQRFSSFFSPSATVGPVFLTRRGTNRIPAEIEQLENEFKRAGFHIIDPGKLCVRQQIELLSGATAIAGIHGASLTNLLWARPGTPVLEIFGSSYLNGCYEQISLQGKLDYASIVLGEPNFQQAIGHWIDNVKHSH